MREYIDSLPINEWIEPNKLVGYNIYELFEQLDMNNFSGYSICWHEIYSNQFMKYVPNTKQLLIKKLSHIENHLSNIEWICVCTDVIDYVVELDNGIILDKSSKPINDVFVPTNHILSMFEWIYHNASDIKIKSF